MARYERRDAWHARAKREGFRSRAAFKLEELQRRARFLRRGQRVVELGCWPGGWLQVLAREVGARGRVVGVDVVELAPLTGTAQVAFVRGDFCERAVLARVREALGGAAHALTSDAAPKLTGVRATDRAREEALLAGVTAAVPALLAPGGALLVKLLDGPEAQTFVTRTRKNFQTTRTLRPQATRKGSTERYLLAQGFRGVTS